MKILHIVGSLDQNSGGPSRSVPQTCEHLSDMGVKITLISRQTENPVIIKTSNLLEVKFLSLKELFFFGFTISSKDYDIIHLQHVWDPYIHVMAFWARCKNIPLIITPRGMLEPWIMNRNPLKKKLDMFLYKKKEIQKAA
ncbi:MAG: hypothetical protein COZ74_10015, partial [Flavobacteriaceae bacterium CG_4_8_14_3_um_filter_31_8]